MRRVVILSRGELSAKLEKTILSRRDVERVVVQDDRACLKAAHDMEPHLVIVEGDDAGAVADLLRTIRGDEKTRGTSLAVVLRSRGLTDDEALREAGANLVVTAGVVPFLWDRWLEELLNVARRRSTRLPVTARVRARAAADEKVEGAALNVSGSGLLLETGNTVELGARLEMELRLAEQEAVTALGQVVRIDATEDGSFLAGVRFLGLEDETRARIEQFVKWAEEA